MSVPDADLLIALSEALETPVSTLLGEAVMESEADAVKALSEKLEIINLQLARRKTMRNAILHWLFIAVCAGIVIVSAVLIAVSSPYLGWDFSDPELAGSHNPDRVDCRGLFDTGKSMKCFPRNGPKGCMG